MINDLGRLGMIAAIALVCIGFVVHGILQVYVMTLGDLYAMFRRVRARTFRIIWHRRNGRSRRCDQSFRGVLATAATWDIPQSPAMPYGPVPRAPETTEVAGTPESVVPPPRTAAATGSVLESNAAAVNRRPIPTPALEPRTGGTAMSS
jgi:hypothetical protein